jgi:CheY-like chemotaxis protein
VEVEDERVLKAGVLARGRYLKLEIEDQGVGIAESAMPRLFEPFYSTKALGKGTGLGLSIAHGVALSHGGAIDVSSQPGIGSCFTIYLPESTEPAVALEPNLHAAAPQGRGEAILVVDDEPALVELAQDLLAELGYEPVGFNSSARALAAFESSPERYAAVLTDEMMPELTGTDLCKRLRGLNSGIPVLVATAFGGDGFESRAADAGATRILRKPYNRHELATALATALGRPSQLPVVLAPRTPQETRAQGATSLMSAQSTTTSSLPANP